VHRASKVDRLGKPRRSPALRRLHQALRWENAAAPGSGADAAGGARPIDASAGDTEAAAPDELFVVLAGSDDTDSLPEYTIYRDDGCHVAPSCLNCPLPACIFDRAGTPVQRQRLARNRAIRSLVRKGWSSRQLAARYGLSPAQVRRIRGPRRPHREAPGS